MAKYPIDVAASIAAYEKEKGEPITGTCRQLLTPLAESENEAYQQGLKDGFLKPFEQATQDRRGVITADTPDDDQELQEELKKLREQLEAEFNEDGFAAVLDNLGPVPSDMTWGEKMYGMTMEAFVVGAIYMLWRHINGERERERTALLLLLRTKIKGGNPNADN